MSTPTTFLGWLAWQTDRDDAIGSVARFAALASCDVLASPAGDGLVDAVDYVESLGGLAVDVAAVHEAWAEYGAAHPDRAPVPVEVADDVRLATPDEEAEAERLAAKLAKDGGAW